MENKNIEREKEVKILNVNIEDIEERLVSLGAIKISEEKQVNTLIDSRDNPIKSKFEGYLRIRETRDLINGKEDLMLTLKKSISNFGIRDNMEYTVNIDNKEVLLEILNNLGFDMVEEGFKHRKSYEYKNTRVDIDVWDKNTYPYPYIEVEFKNEEDLNLVIEDLKIDKSKISTKSIKQLKDELNR